MTNLPQPTPSLTDYLDAFDPSGDDRDLPIPDDAEAENLFRQLANTEARIKANDDMADFEIGKINQWRVMANEPLQNKAIWLRTKLEEYALLTRASTERATVSLPHGTLKTTKAQAEWKIDSTAFVAWAKENRPELLRVKYEPDKGAVKVDLIPASDGTVVTADGEEVPGVTVDRSERYNITITASK